jgi:undecaprenyl-diphosphatase
MRNSFPWSGRQQTASAPDAFRRQLRELGPWWISSAVLTATGRRRPRWAAVRGLAAAAAADLLVRRVSVPPRSAAGALSHVRPGRSPKPSGRAAAAVAYVIGVGTTEPALGPPAAGLALAVTSDRLRRGDTLELLAGGALGAAVAFSGNRLVPTRTPSPVRTVPPRPVPQPSRPDGAGVVLVVNPRSGSGHGGRLGATAGRDLPAAEIVTLEPGDDVDAVMRDAAGQAQVLGVCGGDGTVGAAARAAIDAGRPLLVIPGGTFNHFAADLGIERIADALAALRHGNAVTIDVGTVDGKLFLNTSSLGSYPAFVAVRERWEPRVGKPLAAVIALALAVRRERPLAMEVDGREYRVAMMFLGNRRYQPHGFAPGWRPRLDDGRLDLRMVAVAGRLPFLRLALSVLTGRLGRSKLYIEDDPVDLLVRRPDGSGLLARDGEIGAAPAELEFGKLRRSLTVYRPPHRAVLDR